MSRDNNISFSDFIYFKDLNLSKKYIDVLKYFQNEIQISDPKKSYDNDSESNNKNLRTLPYILYDMYCNTDDENERLSIKKYIKEMSKINTIIISDYDSDRVRELISKEIKSGKFTLLDTLKEHGYSNRNSLF